MNIVNVFQLRLLDHLTSFITVSTTLQYQLSPLLTSVLSSLSWNIPVQCGIFTPIPMSIFWNPYNVGLPIGLPIVGGIHYHIAGVNLLMTVCKSYTGLPSNSATIFLHLPCIHDSLHHRSSLPFHNHFQLPETTTRSHPLLIRPIVSTINSYRFSFFVNNPFLWNTILYSILQIKKSNLLYAALH